MGLGCAESLRTPWAASLWVRREGEEVQAVRRGLSSRPLRGCERPPKAEGGCYITCSGGLAPEAAGWMGVDMLLNLLAGSCGSLRNFAQRVFSSGSQN